MTLRWQDFIEERKEVMLGKPVFKGTRLTVEFVLERLKEARENQSNDSINVLTNENGTTATF